MPSRTKNKFTALASSSENPLRLMLEIIWTKISNKFAIKMPWGDDLTQEIITPLLFAESKSEDDKIGWLYNTYEVSERKLKKIEKKEWSPFFISKNSMLIIRRISATNKSFKINDEERAATKDFCGEHLELLIDELINTSYFVIHQDEITTNHRTTYILDDDEGGWVTTERNRLEQWMENKSMKWSLIHTICLN